MDSWVKGNIFQLTLEQVGKRWGKAGLSTLGLSTGDFLPERGYPAEDFYALLTNIRTDLANDDEYFFKMAVTFSAQDTLIQRLV